MMSKCLSFYFHFFLFALPCVSFATTFSDIQLGNEDNTIKMILDSHGPGSGPVHGPSMVVREQNEYGHGGLRSKAQPTPVPAVVWLLCSGLLGLLGLNENCKNRLSSTSETDLQHQVFEIGHHKGF